MITGKVILKEDGSKKLEIKNLALYERTIRQFKEGSDVNITIEKKKKESAQQRKFYHSAVLSVWCYLDDKDWRDKEVIDAQHEVAKIAFNGEIVVSGGISYKIGKTSRGGALGELTEAIIDFLEDQYAVKRQDCLDPVQFKYWRDVIFPTGSHDFYLSYLASINKLPKK